MNIEKNINYYKNALLGTLVLLSYFILSSLESVPFSLLGINLNEVNMIIKVAYMIIYEVLLMGLIMFILRKSLKKDFLDIKKNHKKYFSNCFKYWIISLIVMMFSNLIINVITGNIAANEQQLRDLFQISPIYIFFSAVIFAPVVEELTFRRAIKNIFKTDTLFILVSGLLFGSLHVATNFSSLWDLLYLIPYSAPGIAFAYMLKKYDNIFVSMGFHFMHNGILMSLQFMILLFG